MTRIKFEKGMGMHWQQEGLCNFPPSHSIVALFLPCGISAVNLQEKADGLNQCKRGSHLVGNDLGCRYD